jgi:hypothetical protein
MDGFLITVGEDGALYGFIIPQKGDYPIYIGNAYPSVNWVMLTHCEPPKGSREVSLYEAGIIS